MSAPSSWATVTARCSWLAFLLVLGVNVVGTVTGLRIIADLIALSTAVCGVLCGIASLFAPRHFGRKGILIPAIVGILLNGLVLAIWIPNFVSSYRHGQASRSQQVGCAPLLKDNGKHGSPANCALRPTHPRITTLATTQAPHRSARG